MDACKYPHFVEALRAYGTPAQIIERTGFNRRQVFEYLSGRALPRAAALLRHPELVEAARRDVEAMDERVAA